MTRIIRRLEAAERAIERSRRRHGIWANYGDTQADIDAERERMIAAGEAHPDDEFFIISWLGWEPGMKLRNWERGTSDGKTETPGSE
jgi:hypothetical protein